MSQEIDLKNVCQQSISHLAILNNLTDNVNPEVIPVATDLWNSTAAKRQKDSGSQQLPGPRRSFWEALPLRFKHQTLRRVFVYMYSIQCIYIYIHGSNMF